MKKASKKHIVLRESQILEYTQGLIIASKSFLATPLPDGFWKITVKDEPGLPSIPGAKEMNQ